MNTLGILLALAAALSITAHNRSIQVLKQHRTSIGRPQVDVAVINMFKFLAVVVIAASLIEFLGYGSWEISSSWFFLFVALGTGVHFALTFTSVRSQQVSEQSLVAPISGSTPLFLLPMAWVVLGEVPSVLGAIAVLTIFSGVIVLAWDSNVKTLKLKYALLHEPGVRYAFAFAFCAALGVIIAKYAFAFASPALYLLSISLPNLAINLYLVLKQMMTHGLDVQKEDIPSIGVSAVTYGLTDMFTFIGLSVMPVAYFTALKRTSIVFNVVAGALWGKESDIGKRLIASALVLAGVVLFTLI